jgi:adenylate cyclase
MQRKLTAILSADVVGYSGLMQADESGTLARLKSNRSAVFDPLVAADSGRIFKLMGDGALAEFPSVVAAVHCALAIQEATTAGSEDVPDDKRIRYRIGVNLGDVMIDGDDIYGEGVNVAARLQTLAPVGGVAVSRMVRDNVEGRLSCTFEDMGEHVVKNHERPVHAFVARSSAVEEAGSRKVDEANKLSICVLPFANMSGEPEQEYFSDGISEDIITDLSKVSALAVISRNSAFMYKGKTVDLPKVARDLKVTHVLEGSVRKSGGRVRITAQLIDGARNEHVWAERYDRDLNDIFALQDEISEAIVKALKLKLLPAEKKAIERRGTDNAEAYNFYLMARQEYASSREGDEGAFDRMTRLCRRAIDIAPDYAQAWALMALAQNWIRYILGRGGDGGLEAADRALALDSMLAEAHAVKAKIFAGDGHQEEAEKEITIALRLDPESHEVNEAAARIRFWQRRYAEAAVYWEKALALMEEDFRSAGMLVTCYTAVGDARAEHHAAEIALARAEKALTHDRNNGAALSHASMALGALGHADRAKEMMNRSLLIDPDNTVARYNFVCTLVARLNDKDAAIEMFAPLVPKVGAGLLHHAKLDPDLDSLRDDPRFQAQIAEAEKRVAAEAAKD